MKKLKSAIYQSAFEQEKTKAITLGHVCDIIKGKQVNGENLTETGAFYVMNGGIVPSGYYHDYNTEANTISISEGGNSCGYVQYNSEKFWSGGHCYTLQNISSQTNTEFLYHYLKYQEEAIMKLRIGSGLPNIQKKDLISFKIMLPVINRQVHLSQVFKSIENKCTIENKLLQLYNEQKRYLLQQMFI